MLPDPGPASARSFPTAFDSGQTEMSASGHFRLLVELREQVDLVALMRMARSAHEGRRQSGERALAAMRAVAARGKAKLTPLLDELHAARQLEYSEALRFRNRFFVNATRAGIERLWNDPAVAAVIPEFDSRRAARRASGNGAGDPVVVPPGDSWGIELLHARQLWEQGVDGRGVVVGILDSGVLGEHVALRAGRAARNSWFDPVDGRPAPVDTRPHGSQVLGCAVARPVAGRALGVAPGATWTAALANQFNVYNNVNMSLAADWLIFEGRPDVLLSAWGHGKGSCDPRDQEMVLAFRAAGIVPVFAAGNDGPDPSSAQAPAALRYPDDLGPIVAGAIDIKRQVIAESSRGPSGCGSTAAFPDVVAPGRDLIAPGVPLADSLTLVSGTSFAVGFVGGAAALVLQIQPDMPVDEVIRILRSTAQDLDAPGVDTISGYGLIDLQAAVDAARHWTRQKPATPK